MAFDTTTDYRLNITLLNIYSRSLGKLLFLRPPTVLDSNNDKIDKNYSKTCSFFSHLTLVDYGVSLKDSLMEKRGSMRFSKHSELEKINRFCQTKRQIISTYQAQLPEHHYHQIELFRSRFCYHSPHSCWGINGSSRLCLEIHLIIF